LVALDEQVNFGAALEEAATAAEAVALAEPPDGAEAALDDAPVAGAPVAEVAAPVEPAVAEPADALEVADPVVPDAVVPEEDEPQAASRDSARGATTRRLRAPVRGDSNCRRRRVLCEVVMKSSVGWTGRSGRGLRCARLQRCKTLARALPRCNSR
jgi:hypothetical protein